MFFENPTLVLYDLFLFMRIRWWIGIALTTSVPIALGQTFPSVSISEVMWMGSDLSSADEWVEIACLGNPQTLSGWTLTRLKDGAEEVIVRFRSDRSIGSGDFLIVSNYPASESRLAGEPWITTTSMVLANTKLLLRLRDAGGNLIDSIDDGVGDPFAGSNSTPKASMERIILSGSGGLNSNWQTATVTLGFDTEAVLFGTPGYANGIIQSEQNNDTEIQLESFNKLKITEIISDPIGSDTEGEWIEIANLGSGSVNIGGLLLGVGEGGTFVLPELSLGSGEYLIWQRPVTGLSLRNSGDIVRLLNGEILIDSIEYPDLPEGVSYGRLAESFQAFCIPTKGKANAVILPDPVISVQSGETHTPIKVTINLEATVFSGSLASAVCSWDYVDGYTSNSCNPPSHTFRTVGRYNIALSLTDYCSNTVERILEVEVLESGVYQEPSFNFVQEASDCTPSVSTGILITDFIPNPEGKDADLEWIELQNRNNFSANLCGWVLDDSEDGSKPFALDEYSILAGSFLKIPITESKIALNNDGDSVRLFFNGNLMQEVFYGDIPEGVSYKNYQNQDGGLPLPKGGDEGEGVKRIFTGAILLNEIYPAPSAGEEEWIELFNPSDESVNLSGLLIDDLREGGSKSWNIHDGTMIQANQYIIFQKEQTKLAFNNDGDEVNLIGPNGALIDSVTYPKLKQGLSFSRKGSRWCETEKPTPFQENVCSNSLHLGGRTRERGSKKFELLNEEKVLNKGIKSNLRTNKVFDNSLPQAGHLPLRGRIQERGIKMFKTIYQHILPKSFSNPLKVTSPYLAQVLEMANYQEAIVSSCHGELCRTTNDNIWEPLLIALGLFSGLCFVFFGLKWG